MESLLRRKPFLQNRGLEGGSEMSMKGVEGKKNYWYLRTQILLAWRMLGLSCDIVNNIESPGSHSGSGLCRSPVVSVGALTLITAPFLSQH